MRRRLDGGSMNAAVCQGACVRTKVPALPAPEQERGA